MSNSLQPADCSPPSSSVHGILQARILEWVAISFSRDLPDPGIKPRSPTLQADALTSAPPGKQNFLQRHRTSKMFKRGKETRLKEGGGGGRGGKRGGLTDVSCHLQIPRHYGTFPWASREGRTGTWPHQISEPEFEFSAKRR